MTKILTANPASVDFGTVKIGETKTVDIEISSTGTQAPTVTDASIEGHVDFVAGAAEEDDYPITVALGKIWTKKDSDLPPRCAFGCVKAGAYIYVVGGRNESAPPIEYMNDCWRSRDGETWEQMSSECFSSGGRSDLALFVVGNKLYAVGGLVNGVATDEIWESENLGHSWVLSSSAFPQKIARMAYAQSGSSLGIYGGMDETGAYSDIFSTSSDALSWSQSAGHAPGARIDCSLARVPSGANVGWYLLCGWDGSVIYDDCWKYTSGPAFVDTGGTPFNTSPRVGIALGANSGAILVHGGCLDWNNPGDTNSEQATLRYSIDGGVNWSNLATTNTGRGYHSMQLRSDGKIVLIAGRGWE